VTLPLDDRTFDLVLLSNWEDQIIYEPDDFTRISQPAVPVAPESKLTTPVNKAFESGAWTQSIIWGPNARFRDFTELELNEEEFIPEEKTSQKPILLEPGQYSLSHPQLKPSDLESDSEQMYKSRTNLISPTIYFTMFQKTADIAFVRPLGNWLWNTPTLHRSCNFHS